MAINLSTILGGLQSGTSVSASGNAVDFTGIPATAKQITVMFNGVTTNATSPVIIQVGSGSFSTSGYASGASYSAVAGAYINATIGLAIEPTGASASTAVRYGGVVISLISSNIYTSQGSVYSGPSGGPVSASGGVTPNLAGALDRIRITTLAGTSTFNAGSINIMYQ
jgi:hypothetical protein